MIDADDTLWENNIYFERAIANFISFLNHRHFSAAQVRIHGFARTIAEQPIELLKHVSPTLEALRSRHRLLLVTKGNVAEQLGKVERSGLGPYFEAVEVVAEKNAETYRAVVEKFGLERSVTWMVGNSPKSDINPAIEAGLNAVFIPHAETWILEHAELRSAPEPQQLLTVERFELLSEVF